MGRTRLDSLLLPLSVHSLTMWLTDWLDRQSNSLLLRGVRSGAFPGLPPAVCQASGWGLNSIWDAICACGLPINHTRRAFYHLYGLKCFWRLMLFEKCASAGAWARGNLEGRTFQTCNCCVGIITEGRVFNIQLNRWITNTHPPHFSPQNGTYRSAVSQRS